MKVVLFLLMESFCRSIWEYMDFVNSCEEVKIGKERENFIN